MNEIEDEYMDIRQFALTLGGLQPQTIHKCLCEKGHYSSSISNRLKNGRLLWRKDDTAKLVGK